ncbi:MAG: 30S ribosomal protein S15 [Candidatus Euphemobacter frigidus]|nr:30S ribosomal protein S15 [Candidatus Euphemobacter frigidus]MDP8275139.1 30S ribosomal protein S15 [Candidatus Euphemobacter frigidus]
MSGEKTKREEIIDSLGYHGRDTGSSGVQIAILTDQINLLTEHMKAHHKDFRSKRSLLIMVSQRQKHLRYLKRTKPEKYREVVEKLHLRK